MSLSINANQSAFLTVSALAAVAVASGYAVATAATTTAAIAFAVLGITAVGASGVAITAWLDKDSKDARSYFAKLQEHAGSAAMGTGQFASQIIKAGIQSGVVTGIARLISRMIAGPDNGIGRIVPL